ncbi:MAG TPA: AzlC family ABC transporter permease [Arachnia sp.]|nr:AzlC family ABC transporter permease [Arachnia sp.]
MSTARSPRGEIREGVAASLAAGLGLFPLGLALGLLVIQHGLPWWLAPALSIFVYAGSIELLLVGMIATATPLLTVALATLLVNFRHVFYAFSFPLKVVRNPVARFYSLYALTDETYAVTSARPTGWTSWRLVALQASLQSYWVAGGLVGVLLGSLLPAPIQGIGFALTALFITLALDACRSVAQLPVAVLGAVCYVVAAVVIPQAALFVGLLLLLGGLVGRFAVASAREVRANA